VRLALQFQSEEAVRQRLKELAEAEARIMAEGDERPRMHS
jgi:tRNA isopentenyl-2-thiomethyl-A-37 hydroxylase MiaE